jgi:hypothetical protein
MNSPVCDEPLDRLLGDLAAVRIESRKNDSPWCVVDDQVDAGRELEGTDVPSLAADDASLQIVAWQVDDGDGCFDGVLGR